MVAIYKAIEAAFQKVYGVDDAAAHGHWCDRYVATAVARGPVLWRGAAPDDEDVLKGFGAHSDQEWMPEDSVAKHLAFLWNAVTAIAGAKFYATTFREMG